MSRKQLSDLDFGGVARIRNLPAPVNPDEPVRQQDLNSAVEGLAWKDSCRVASQANVNLSSPGASIDGITLTVGDRILVKAQTVGSENGLYIWNGAAVVKILEYRVGMVELRSIRWVATPPTVSIERVSGVTSISSRSCPPEIGRAHV